MSGEIQTLMNRVIRLFSKKEEPKHSVHLKLRIANGVIHRLCQTGVDPDTLTPIKTATRLNTYDYSIQKAEVSLVPGPRDLWFHHGPSIFASTPDMTIDIGHKTEQLSFKMLRDWFVVETTYSKICVFCAPTNRFKELIEKGHLGYAGPDGKSKDIPIIGHPWLEPINERIDGGIIKSDGSGWDWNGIAVIYTNEAIQLTISHIFDVCEHDQLWER